VTPLWVRGVVWLSSGLWEAANFNIPLRCKASWKSLKIVSVTGSNPVEPTNRSGVMFPVCASSPEKEYQTRFPETERLTRCRKTRVPKAGTGVPAILQGVVWFQACTLISRHGDTGSNPYSLLHFPLTGQTNTKTFKYL